MKAGFLALPAGVVVAVIVAAPAFAQLAQKPVYPRLFVAGSMVPMPSFASYRDFYASIAAARQLPDSNGDAAIQQVESHASIDSLRDYSGDPIIVVKLEQSETPGLYSFYVIREVESRLRVLGQMNGYGYETTTARGHLEFVLDTRGRATTAPRFQVDGNFLVNLADLASLDRNDPVELDLRNAF